MEVFKAGDLAVYPAHGVGRIEAVESRRMCGEDQLFYILRILDSGLTILIPTGNAQNVGLRAIINSQQVEEVMAFLAQKSAPRTSQTWNRRYRVYMDKIKTGSPYMVAEVLRELNSIKSERELSFGERRVRDMAEGLLVKELSVAKAAREEEVARQIEQLFG